MLHFTRVVFGFSASPFLLNATIDHHMKKLESADHHFVDKFRRSIYVDEVATGAADVEGAYEFYLKAKLHLAKASFNLRKFESNSSDLCQRIKENEQGAHKVNSLGPVAHICAQLFRTFGVHSAYMRTFCLPASNRCLLAALESLPTIVTRASAGMCSCHIVGFSLTVHAHASV